MTVKKLGAIALTGFVGMGALLGLPAKAHAEDVDGSFGYCARQIVGDHAPNRGDVMRDEQNGVVSYVATNAQRQLDDGTPIGKTVMISQNSAGYLVTVVNLPSISLADTGIGTPKKLEQASIQMSAEPSFKAQKPRVNFGVFARDKKSVVEQVQQIRQQFTDCMSHTSSMEPTEVSPFYQPLASAQAESTKAKIEAYANAYELRPVDKAAAKRVLKAGVNGSMLELKR